MAAASSSGSLGSTTTSPTRNMNGADDMEGSKKNHARASNIARKLQEKLISDSQNLVSCGFAELPAVINLSFVLENVAGAVKECHVQKIKSDQPKSTLFDWIWNEKEIPKLIVLGSWWLCALLTQGKTPIGKEIGSLSEFGIEVLKKVEDVSLRGLAKIFSTMLSHHAIEMKHHGGVAAHRASHAIFSSILPDAIARATRDCAFLTWPHLRPFLETPECCTALVGVWSYLITGDKGSHLFAKNIEYSKVKNWGIPTDLAPTQLHLRKAEADQPSTFPALERRRQRERAIRDRVMLVQENNRLLALPYHEREMIERMKKNAASTCPMGIPLKPTEPLTGQEKGPPRMRHGRFVLGTSPLVELSMATTSMTVDSTGGANTADIVNIDLHSTHSDLSMREDDMSLGSEKRSVMTRRLSLSEMLSPPPVNDTRVTGLTGRLLGLQGSVQQRAESRKQNMAKRGETVVSLTFAPPVYEVNTLVFFCHCLHMSNHHISSSRFSRCYSVSLSTRNKKLYHLYMPLYWASQPFGRWERRLKCLPLCILINGALTQI